MGLGRFREHWSLPWLLCSKTAAVRSCSLDCGSAQAAVVGRDAVVVGMVWRAVEAADIPWQLWYRKRDDEAEGGASATAHMDVQRFRNSGRRTSLVESAVLIGLGSGSLTHLAWATSRSSSEFVAPRCLLLPSIVETKTPTQYRAAFPPFPPISALSSLIRTSQIHS